MQKNSALAGGAGALILLLAATALFTSDHATWMMEVAPVMIALPILIASHKKFPLSGLLYSLLFLHALILILGGTYTYAKVPLGFWIQDILSLDRNPYDRIGHFAQGFVPAIVAREILLRGRHMTKGRMAAFVSICVAMAISAWYELIEWWAALALGQDADAFLGTQGDPWDTQSDMFMAFLGASLAMLVFPPVHDRSIAKVPSTGAPCD